LYKDDRYALITSNNHLDQKLFDLRKDPGWNSDISNDNPDICKDLFKKIEKDAKGGLILEAETALDDLQNWYMQKKISDN
jgi:hypothetical protein